MVPDGATSKVQDLDLSDDDTEALFASPSRPQRPKPSKSETQQSASQQSRTVEHRDADDHEAREVALRKELAGIRNINQVIEGAIDSLERAEGSMGVCSATEIELPY